MSSTFHLSIFNSEIHFKPIFVQIYHLELFFSFHAKVYFFLTFIRRKTTWRNDWLYLHVAQSLSQFVVSQSKGGDKTVVDDFIVTTILARNMKLADSRLREKLELNESFKSVPKKCLFCLNYTLFRSRTFSLRS